MGIHPNLERALEVVAMKFRPLRVKWHITCKCGNRISMRENQVRKCTCGRYWRT